MAELLAVAEGLTVAQTALVVLSVIIVALFAVTMAFSIYTIVLRIRNERRDRLWRDLTERWEAPVLDAIMEPEAVPAVWPQVPDRYRLHFVQFVLEYTRRVRGEERRTLARLAEPYLDSIAERLDDRRAEIRTRAVQTLGTLGLPKYADQVMAGLDDPSPLVSMVAARSLARRDHPEFAPVVMKHLARFDGWNPRFLASMLAAMGPEASQTFRQGLADPATPAWLRAVEAEALRMQLDPASGDIAVEALGNTTDRELVASLLRLIAAVGRPEHVSLIRGFCTDADPVIRAHALHALGELGTDADIPMLLDAMSDPSPWVALHAARGVREAGGSKMLVELARSDGVPARLAGQVLHEAAHS